ncbi:antifreeze protein [Mycena metata]|uniref:Antifreeze protein n=1 Tax=Mycena metata TaxID=1033252 RepID=A0AAD7NGM6_9AGAR|nr:antifreeze protein [Mycena metata]
MSTIRLNLAAFVLFAFVGFTLAAGPAPVLLGTAANYAILAKTGVSSVPNSAVMGNVGVSPATITSVTGFSLVQDVSKQFWTSTQVNGQLMGSTDALPTPGRLTIAVNNMQTAYVDASTRPLPNFVGLKAGLIGGSVLVPGLYKWTTGVTISTGLTLSGGPADTWIFQIAGTLVQAANVKITLIGGAQSKNIIWAVAGTVTVGTNGVFQGNILAKTNVVIATNAIDNGCIYAQTAVTLQKATNVSISAPAVRVDAALPTVGHFIIILLGSNS